MDMVACVNTFFAVNGVGFDPVDDACWFNFIEQTWHTQYSTNPALGSSACQIVTEAFTKAVRIQLYTVY